MKRPRVKSPAKIDAKPRSRTTKIGEEINATLAVLREALKAPPPPPPMPSFNSDAALWQRLDNMTITTDQNMTVGMFLASKEQKGMCDTPCVTI